MTYLLLQETAWAISNVTAGTQTQIQAVIDTGCLQPLIDILVKGDFKAQKEAAWAVTNLTTGGNVQQIVHLCGEVSRTYLQYEDADCIIAGSSQAFL